MGEADRLPVTRLLAEACRAITFDDLPDDVVVVAKQCLLDWLGVTLAGSGEPLATILREVAVEEGGRPQATLIGSGERVPSRQAALVNGAASHALDYDDVLTAMSGHPSVPVIPALLALAEARGAGGRDFIAALVAGVEMEARIGALVMPGHYATGFHATGTLGTFGAAAACAHLLHLSLDQWTQALGIAGAQAAGLKSMFGTMTKPLQAGKAAANGLLAAMLAARGFTGNPAVLETEQGFAATQTMTRNPERALAGLRGDFAIRDVLFKYHASCYGTHETIEGVLRLKQAHALRPEQVEAIHLQVPPGNLAMCNIQAPVTELEGKFSMRFTAALALGHGDTGEQAFNEATVRDPRLAALRERVTVAAGAPGERRGTTVTMRLSGGDEVSEHVDLTIPAADLDWQGRQLAGKFTGLASPVVGTSGAQVIVDAVHSVEDLAEISALVRLAVAQREAVGAR